jgi:metal-sulfur cluster biosynthetic enzyme
VADVASPGNPRTPAFAYAGPAGLEAPLTAALSRVVDPEMALNIVDLGLVYGVKAEEGRVDVDLTMTSAACPVAELIIDDVTNELIDLLGTETKIQCRLVWDPPWSPQRMSLRARTAMGWD